MEHNRKQLWKKNEVRQPLRVPNMLLAQQQNSPSDENTSTNSQENNEIQNLTTIEEIVANSSLKVDAPEFVPRFSRSKPQYVSTIKPSVQDRLKIPRTETNCNVTEEMGNNLDYSNASYFDTQSDLRRLKQIIGTLTKDPGQFDNLVQIIVDTVIPYLEDLVLLPEIVEIIVNEAIENANFRYSGAKLCWYIEQNCPSFRAALHLECRKRLEQGVNNSVLLFIGELYVQLPHVNIYGTLLVEAFQRLFSEGSNDNIKYICQALKLTGFSLENSHKEDLDNIMATLEALKNKTSGTVSYLINQIVERRSNNWGRTSTEQFAAGQNRSEELDDEYVAPDHAFFEQNLLNHSYLNADTDLTQEEEDFLTANLVSNAELYSHPDSEDEMDDEIQEAYEEFLKLSFNK